MAEDACLMEKTDIENFLTALEISTQPDIKIIKNNKELLPLEIFGLGRNWQSLQPC